METKEEFQMIVDDSGYNHTAIGADGKLHEVSPTTDIPTVNPKKGVGHHKYFVGILIPSEQIPNVCADIENISAKFRHKLALSGTFINEIHATEMYNSEQIGGRQAFVEYLKQVTHIIKKYNLTVFVSPKDSTIRTRTEKQDGILKNYIANLYPYYPNSTPSKKAQRRKNLGYQKQSLRELIDMANIYLSDGGYVSTVLCDEGLHKPGTQIQVTDNTAIMFLSSEDNSLIQFVDAVAWFRNRVKELNKGDVLLSKIYDSISGNIIEHDESRVEKTFNNMMDYLNNQTSPIIINRTFTRIPGHITKASQELPRVKVSEVKYPPVVLEQDDELVK